MADDIENDDQWLYGDNPDLPAVEPQEKEAEAPTEPEAQEETHPEEKSAENEAEV